MQLKDCTVAFATCVLVALMCGCSAGGNSGESPEKTLAHVPPTASSNTSPPAIQPSPPADVAAPPAGSPDSPIETPIASTPPISAPASEPPPPVPISEPQPKQVFPGTTHTVAPEEDAIRRAEASTPNYEITTTRTIDAMRYGLVGDGHTDNTNRFQELLAVGSQTIRVPAGDYITSKVEIAANTILILEPGVIIRDAGRLGKYDRLLNVTTQDVRITGFGARVIAERSDYTTDEWRHGVYIFGATRVLVEGLESSGHGGDGFYVGGPPNDPSTDIVIRGCRADNNRRQGLSVTSARRVRVVDCEFLNTRGTDPQFGIDLEPNAPVDFMDDIVILRAQTRENFGGGVLVWLRRLDATSHPVDITILDHLSDRDAVHLYTEVPSSVRGLVRYQHAAE